MDVLVVRVQRLVMWLIVIGFLPMIVWSILAIGNIGAEEKGIVSDVYVTLWKRRNQRLRSIWWPSLQ